MLEILGLELAKRQLAQAWSTIYQLHTGFEGTEVDTALYKLRSKINSTECECINIEKMIIGDTDI